MSLVLTGKRALDSRILIAGGCGFAAGVMIDVRSFRSEAKVNYMQVQRWKKTWRFTCLKQLEITGTIVGKMFEIGTVNCGELEACRGKR
jgi:hypothetical protein